MKKLVASIIAIVLLLSLSTSIFAVSYDLDPDTTSADVEISLEEAQTYEITLPTDLNLTKSSNIFSGTGEIAVDDLKLASNETLEVKVNGGENYSSGFRMKSTQNDYNPYTITSGVSTVLVEDAVAASFTMASNSPVTLTFSAGIPTYSGSYSDTLTFTVSISD